MNPKPTKAEPSKARGSVMIKLIVTVLLALFLMIPSSLIMSIVQERQAARQEAENEIGQKLGQTQTVVGPIISLKDSAQESYTHILPEKLEIKSEIETDTRHRGIFEVAVYKTKINLKGSFKKINFNLADNNPEKIDLSKCYLQIGISDMTGIKNALKLKWNNTEVDFKPSLIASGIFSGISNQQSYVSGDYPRTVAEVPVGSQGSSEGVHIPLSELNISRKDSSNSYNFEANIELSGSKELKFAPIGKETTVDMKANWGNPSFIGSYLPIEREVSAKNFNAKWKVLEFNRSFPQVIRNATFNVLAKSFGVNLLVPIDGYAQTNRAIKYSYLFVGLTFIAFFLIEVVNKLRLHPIQYLLVGFALSLFYLLLLSISEYISFEMAYLCAFVAIIGLITIYSAYMFRSKKLATFLCLLLTFQYGYLYVLLSLADYSLLLGSIGLFVIIALVMWVTRKLDWYALGDNATNSLVTIGGSPNLNKDNLNKDNLNKDKMSDEVKLNEVKTPEAPKTPEQ